MNDKEIKAIVESCGYSMYTNDHIGKGNGKATTYVYAYKGGVRRCLGNESKVGAMSEAQLRTHIAEKFAQGTRRKSNDEQSRRAPRRRRTWLYAAH